MNKLTTWALTGAFTLGVMIDHVLPGQEPE